MSFRPDNLIDRALLKRSLLKWRILSLFLLFIALILFFKTTEHSIPTVKKPFIAKIHINGLIDIDQKRVEVLNDMANNPNIKAVIVKINSSGGTAVGGEIIFNTLRKIANNNKNIVAVLEDVAASGGYMSAIGADYIIAHNGTITGSIGVVMPSFEASSLFEKLGIKPELYKSSKYKFSPNYFEPHSKESQEVIKEMISDNADFFKNLVAERRNISADKINSIANGKVYSAQKALELNLIDAIGSEDKAVEWIYNQDNMSNFKDLPIREIKLHKVNFVNTLNNSIKSIFDKFKLYMIHMVI